MNISDRIDVAMRIAGFTNQAEFSRVTDIPKSTLSRILSGESSPSPENLIVISTVCKRSIDWIVTGTDTTHSTVLEVALVHVSPEELKLLTQFREATDAGKNFIQIACASADKKSTINPADDQS